MSRASWMPFYIGDFLADTMHLGATDRGIYISLIIHCWQHGSIPRDKRKLARIAACDSRLWHQHADTVLQFFDVVDASTMQHKRVSTELHRYAELSNKRKEAAEQKHKSKDAIAEHLHTPSPSPSPSPEKLKRNIYPPKVKDDWPENYRNVFWEAYPRKVGKGSAIRKLEAVRGRGEVSFARLLTAVRTIEASEEKFIPHPTTWLNQGRYLDVEATGPPRAFEPPLGAPTDAELREKWGKHGIDRGTTEKPTAEGARVLEEGFRLRKIPTNGLDRDQ